MAITTAQAKELRETLADVFTPAGDAGVIERVRTFTTADGIVTKAKVSGRLVHGEWFPLSDLDTADTLRALDLPRTANLAGLKGQALRDAEGVLSFGAGTRWSAVTGFRPNRERELIEAGVLIPAEGGEYVVGVAPGK